MFLLDDILKAPAQGLLWVVQELHEAARRDRENEAGQIRNSLRDLYLKVEQGEITDQEFDEQERVLLDRLDVLEADAPSEEEDEFLTENEPDDETDAEDELVPESDDADPGAEADGVEAEGEEPGEEEEGRADATPSAPETDRDRAVNVSPEGERLSGSADHLELEHLRVGRGRSVLAATWPRERTEGEDLGHE